MPLVLTRRHDATGEVSVPVGEKSYASWLSIMDASEIEELLDALASEQWRDNIFAVPKVTGDLRTILVVKQTIHRRWKAKAGHVVLLIRHNGVAYRASVRNAVLSALNVRQLLKDLIDGLKSKQRERNKAPRRGLGFRG